jgi:predicted N-acetyltransferase YhbS
MILVRPFRPEDVSAIVELFRDTVRRVNSRDYSPEQVRAWAPDQINEQSWADKLSGRLCLVAERQGQVVGFGDVEEDGHLDHLFTHADHQVRGVGRAILQALEDVAGRQGLVRLHTEASITARPFFERQGYRVVQEQEVLCRGVAFVNYRMEASLDRLPRREARRLEEALAARIRPERAEDADGIGAVHRAAFPTDEEARLVDRLRAAGRARASLVAEAEGRVVGHVVFSPVRVGPREGLGLAPMAVLPALQRRGVGSALVREGLAACRRECAPFVVVLGHPGYYPRFGFLRASSLGLSNQYGADEAFMVLELQPGSLPAGGGLVEYGPDFAGWNTA